MELTAGPMNNEAEDQQLEETGGGGAVIGLIRVLR